MSISELTPTIDMKKILLILPFLLILQADISAQVTAVLKVSVNVVSGVKAETPANLFLSNSPTNSHNGEVIITSSPSSDVEIETKESCTLTNNSGHSIQIKTDSLFDFNPDSGTHSLSINGDLPSNKKISGNYTGNLVTTIVYL